MARTKRLPTSEKSSSGTTSVVVTSLWAGYGQIRRFFLADGSTRILKTILPPVLRPADIDEGHARKVISYHVERFFYQNLAGKLPADVKVAESFPVEHPDRELLLEDLDHDFDVDGHAYCSMTLDRTTLVLQWLARFHSAFCPLPPDLTLISEPDPQDPAAAIDSIPAGIWRTGTYSYLATRTDEFRSLNTSSRFGFILPYARWVDAQLNDAAASGRAIVHGDVKSANIAFPRDGRSVALYDFQYVGAGLGVRDVVYFLATAVETRLLTRNGWRALLRLYWDAFVQAGGERGYTWEVCQEQFDWAVVDWARFLGSWGTWGSYEWVEGRAKEIIERWTNEGMLNSASASGKP